MDRILITGSNRGLGLELARQHLLRGDQVWAACRVPAQAGHLLGLVKTYAGQLTILQLDVGDASNIQAASLAVGAQTQALERLYNNAAIYVAEPTLADVRTETLLEFLRINAVGPLLIAQAFAGLLKVGQQPRLINISSESGSVSNRHWGGNYSYSGSKAALNLYTRGLAFEPELANIITIAMHPGWMRTDMGGEKASLSVEEAARGILNVVDHLTPTDQGKFYTWDGREHPW